MTYNTIDELSSEVGDVAVFVVADVVFAISRAIGGGHAVGTVVGYAVKTTACIGRSRCPVQGVDIAVVVISQTHIKGLPVAVGHAANPATGVYLWPTVLVTCMSKNDCHLGDPIILKSLSQRAVGHSPRVRLSVYLLILKLEYES